MGIYFDKYKIYYDNLNGKSYIVSKAEDFSSLCQNYKSRFQNTYNIDTSLLNGNGRRTLDKLTLFLASTSFDRFKNFLVNNLMQACQISTGSLFPVVENIKEEDEVLEKIEAELETVKARFNSNLSILNSMSSKDPGYSSMLDLVTSLRNAYERLIQDRTKQILSLNNLSKQANDLINKINSLNNALSSTIGSPSSAPELNIKPIGYEEELVTYEGISAVAYFPKYANGETLENLPLIVYLPGDSSRETEGLARANGFIKSGVLVNAVVLVPISAKGTLKKDEDFKFSDSPDKLTSTVYNFIKDNSNINDKKVSFISISQGTIDFTSIGNVLTGVSASCMISPVSGTQKNIETMDSSLKEKMADKTNYIFLSIGDKKSRKISAKTVNEELTDSKLIVYSGSGGGAHARYVDEILNDTYIYNEKTKKDVFVNSSVAEADIPPVIETLITSTSDVGFCEAYENSLN